MVRVPILANQFQEAQLLLRLNFLYRRALLLNSHNTPKARGDGIFTDISGLAVGRFKFEELWATLFALKRKRGATRYYRPFDSMIYLRS